MLSEKLDMAFSYRHASRYRVLPWRGLPCRTSDGRACSGHFIPMNILILKQRFLQFTASCCNLTTFYKTRAAGRSCSSYNNQVLLRPIKRDNTFISVKFFLNTIIKS
jgi:hypothetical protein